MIRCTPFRVGCLIVCLFINCYFQRASAGEKAVPPDKKSSDQNHLLLARAVHPGPLDKPGDQFTAVNTLEHTPQFVPDPYLFQYHPMSTGMDPRQNSIILEWRKYVDEQLGQYRTVIDPDYSFCAKPPCNPDAIAQPDQNKRVGRALLKDTAAFIRKKASWIDAVVRYSRLEFAHNATKDMSLDSVKDPGPVDMSSVKPKKADDVFSFNGGLKTNFTEGTVSVVGEAKARYNSVNSFYRYNPGKHSSIVGMEYPLQGGMLLQFRHESNYTSQDSPEGFIVQSKASVQMLKLIYQF